MFGQQGRLDAVRHGSDLEGHGGVENVGAVTVLRGEHATG